MAKQQKTAKELEDLLQARARAEGIYCQLSVAPDPAYGWHPTVFATPSNAAAYQLRIEKIASELRTQFDLTPSTSKGGTR
jgi:hypothetical protein